MPRGFREPRRRFLFQPAQVAADVALPRLLDLPDLAGGPLVADDQVVEPPATGGREPARADEPEPRPRPVTPCQLVVSGFDVWGVANPEPISNIIRIGRYDGDSVA